MLCALHWIEKLTLRWLSWESHECRGAAMRVIHAHRGGSLIIHRGGGLVMLVNHLRRRTTKVLLMLLAHRRTLVLVVHRRGLVRRGLICRRLLGLIRLLWVGHRWASRRRVETSRWLVES